MTARFSSPDGACSAGGWENMLPFERTNHRELEHTRLCHDLFSHLVVCVNSDTACEMSKFQAGKEEKHMKKGKNEAMESGRSMFVDLDRCRTDSLLCWN